MKCKFCKYYTPQKSLCFGLGIQYEKCKINSFNLRKDGRCRIGKFGLIAIILNATLNKIPF